MPADSLTIELFTELGVGILIFGVRFFARWRLVGFHNFGMDDICAAVAVIFWVLETTFLYTCGLYGNNIGLNEKTAMEVPDSKMPSMILGSKHAYAAWVFYILLIWSLKGVLLFLYKRLTMGLWQQKLANVMIFVTGCTFLSSLLWHICSCLPVHRAWQIKPFPGNNCTIRPGNYIIITVLDVLTDIGIMAVPLPMLLQANLDLKRKVTLFFLFSSGLFVIACAIVRAYYSLKNITTLTVALSWASREIFVACIVVCAPSMKPLISQVKSTLSGNHSSDSSKRYGTSSRGRSRLPDNEAQPEAYLTTITAGVQKDPGCFKLASVGRWRSERDGQPRVSRSESQERNSETGNRLRNENPNGDRRMERGIMITTEYSLAENYVGPK